MAVTIYASLKPGKVVRLKLRDSQNHNPGDSNINSEVEPEETITWKLDNPSGLSEIIGIKESDSNLPQYQHSTKLWDDEPKQNKDGSWTVKITKDDTNRPKFQNYMVGYKVSNDNNEYWEDPKLSMIIK